MSEETWKAEFMPVSGSEVTKEDAVSHSLLKWKGRRSDNLERHNLTHTPETVCALCHLYVVYEAQNDEEACAECPITLATGKPCQGTESPWHHWMVASDPEPMIAVLERTLEWENANRPV